MNNEYKHKDHFDPVEVNRLLVSHYGKELDGRARFKLVWAANQYEKRIFEYDDYSGPIYIGTKRDVRELPKYSWIHDRWVLEILVFGNPLPALVEAKNGSYEPLWVFSASDGSFLTPHWWAVDYVIRARLNRHLFLTESTISGGKVAQSDFESRKMKRRLIFRDMLDDDAFYGKLSKASGEGIGYTKPMMQGTTLGDKDG